MKKPSIEAALHLAQGALKSQDVPPGHHDLSRVQVTLTFPEFAAVDRGAGTQGDGFDAGDEPPGLELPAAAVLLFVNRLLEESGELQAEWAGLWYECIRAALAGADADPPPSALVALARVQAELPPAAPVPRRTAAKRTGASEVAIAVKRLPKAKAAAS